MNIGDVYLLGGEYYEITQISRDKVNAEYFQDGVVKTKEIEISELEKGEKFPF